MDTEKEHPAAEEAEKAPEGFEESTCSACGAEMHVDWDARTATCSHCGNTAHIYSREVASIVEKRQLIAKEHGKQAEHERRAEAIRDEIGRRSDTRDMAGCLLQFALGVAAPIATIWAAGQLIAGQPPQEVLDALLIPLLLMAGCAANIVALQLRARPATLEAVNRWGFAIALAILVAVTICKASTGGTAL